MRHPKIITTNRVDLDSAGCVRGDHNVSGFYFSLLAQLMADPAVHADG